MQCLNGRNPTSYIFYGSLLRVLVQFHNNENYDGSLFSKLRKLRPLKFTAQFDQNFRGKDRTEDNLTVYTLTWVIISLILLGDGSDFRGSYVLSLSLVTPCFEHALVSRQSH